jgi:hypothetical protein
MPFVLLAAAVTLHGREVAAGNVIELPEKSARALVNEGLGVFAEPTAGTAAELAALANGNPVENGATQHGGQLPPDGGNVANTGAQYAEIEKLKKALDNQYKKDELAEAAKAIGVDFPYDANKAEIIEAAIEQGKAEALLK